ncbi:MAG: hypothetical protein RLZZ155_14, partial [Bacteroidota bacterium]
MKDIIVEINITYYSIRARLFGYKTDLKLRKMEFKLSDFQELRLCDFEVKPNQYKVLNLKKDEISKFLISIKNKITFECDVIKRLQVTVYHNNKIIDIFCSDTNTFLSAVF